MSDRLSLAQIVALVAYAGAMAGGQLLFKMAALRAVHEGPFIERAVTFTTCPECDGTRLSAPARSSKIEGINIADACAMQISDLAAALRPSGLRPSRAHGAARARGRPRRRGPRR